MTVTAGQADRAADDQATLQRAEEWVDRAVQDVRRFSVRLAARAREQAEDIWAEAEALRRSGPPPDDRA